MNYAKLTERLTRIALSAGDSIMKIYSEFPAAKIKSDGSPVTEADEAAEKIILTSLRELAPDIAIVSEEQEDSHCMKVPDRFFLVDPLDGTKEFIKHDGSGSFTVNIALIEKGVPVLGVVYAPALGRLFAGTIGEGATETANGLCHAISIRKIPATGPVAVASCSHRDAQTDKWLAEHRIANTVSIGSSLKFCLVACGEADIYPRFGPTMEWDTAAGDAVLRAAGGHIATPENGPFLYGKPDFRNGPFVAKGQMTVPDAGE